MQIYRSIGSFSGKLMERVSPQVGKPDRPGTCGFGGDARDPPSTGTFAERYVGILGRWRKKAAEAEEATIPAKSPTFEVDARG